MCTCRWSTIARYLPGRTDNEIKNYWRTHFKTKKQEKSLKQQQQEQESETGSHGFAYDDMPQVKNSKEDEEMAMIPSMDDDREFWGKVYEESGGAASDHDEFMPMDCYLWDGLWNLDYDNDVQNVCTQMGVDQTQPYYNPFLQGDDFLL